MTEYKICARCVMDTTDQNISFDDDGVCDHCYTFDTKIKPSWDFGEKGRAALHLLVEQIRKSGKNKEFDCILGLSGGLDSSYMLHMLVQEFGLRPLVFHVDGGWNTDISVKNIQVLVDKLGLDLFTEVINWNEMRDFQLSFFKSGVSHLDTPQDHAFISTLYHFANKYNIKYIMNGGNYSTECVRNPKQWLYYGTDMAQIFDIQKRFGTLKLETFPFSSIFFHKIYLRYFKQIRVIKPLNFIPYTKKSAIELLAKEYGWQSYHQKHFESRFTKFFEGYWLPTRFGYDTRRVQFSSLILTNQMTRADAIEKLKDLPYDIFNIDEEFEYVATKLGITVNELRYYHQMPLKSFKDYRNHEWLFDFGALILKNLGIEKAVKR